AVLRRLFAVRGALEPAAGAVRSPAMDRPDHAHLGPDLGRTAVRPDADAVLRDALPAGRRRGGLLSRRPAVPVPLVSQRVAGPVASDVVASRAVDHGFLRPLSHPLVLALGAAMALAFGCANAVAFSAPKLLMQATGWSATDVGLLTALGGLLATAAMLFVGWRSDRRRERRLHLTAVIGLTAASVAAMALASGPIATVLAYLAYATTALS